MMSVQSCRFYSDDTCEACIVCAYYNVCWPAVTVRYAMVADVDPTSVRPLSYFEN